MKAITVVCLAMLMLFCSFGFFRIAGAGDDFNIIKIPVWGRVERHFGDFNSDHLVDAKDALILEQNFGTHNAIADANNDGVVDILDALAVSTLYGRLQLVLLPTVSSYT